MQENLLYRALSEGARKNMTDEELMDYSQKGFIPFEGEPEEAFLKRANFSDHILVDLERHLGKAIPPCPEILSEAIVETEKIYGIAPNWVPILFSNEKLLPWQGGAAWIFQLEEGSPLSALIQLREKVFSFFGTQKERVIHELSHIGRLGFKEEKYEEFLAYLSSKSPFRRTFGPLFRSAKESLIFASLLALIVVFDLLLFLSGSLAWYDRFIWLKAVPLFYLGYLLIRLYIGHKRLHQTLQRLPLPLVFRLTDNEIDLFANSSTKEIETYFREGQHLSPRRRLLYLTYLRSVATRSSQVW